jgi:serine/threonine-protein kinase
MRSSSHVRTPSRYHRLSEHFQACIGLPDDAREEYLSGPRVEDPGLRDELRSLLNYLPPARPEPRAAFSTNLRPMIILGLGLLVASGILVLPRQVTVSTAMLPAIPLLVTAALIVPTILRRFRRARHAGPYLLDRRIGKGGMAEIFLAHHRILNREVAVKIHPASAGAGVEREARLAGRLGHPNTIQIFDVGEMADGRFYCAMEYVDGLTLSQLLALEGPLPVVRVIHFLREISGALEEAHELGLVHRDLKPSNIMVSCPGARADAIKVLDFGIACSSSEPGPSPSLVGTPAYIAPERLRSPNELDPRSDLYSFGAVAFFLLTGRSVFEGSTPVELFYQALTARRPSASQVRGAPVPPGLEELIGRCLSVEPGDRPSGFREIEEALIAMEASDRWDQAEARRWWAANRERVSRFTEAAA